MRSSSRSSRKTIFEAINPDLKEIYVAATALPIFEAMSELGRNPPPQIAHWDLRRQRIEFRSLMFDLSANEARLFISKRLATAPLEGWNYCR